MKFDFEKHKAEISEWKRKGNGSRTIADKLYEKYKVEVHSSSIRRAIARWGVTEDFIPNNQAKVLLIDLETSHIIARVWGKWNQNINDNDIIKDWMILCWSGKWLFDEKIYNCAMTKKEIKNGNDKRVTKSLWQMFNEADVVIAHNLNKFDAKKANSKFILHGLNSPKPYLSIDTLLHARKQFKMTSNRLDYLGEILGVGRKIDTPKGLWNMVEDGDMEAMKEMVKYCDQDVKLLEDVYLKMRGWIKPAPNLGLFSNDNEPVCPSCGSNDLKPNGEYHTTVSTYQNYSCNNCGSHSRGRKTNLSKEQSSKILSSSPK